MIGFDMKSILIPNKFPDFVVFIVFSLSFLVNGGILGNFIVDKLDIISVSDASKTYKIFFIIFRCILKIMSFIIIFIGCIFIIVILSVLFIRGFFIGNKGFYDYYIHSTILAILFFYWLYKQPSIKRKKRVAKTKLK